MKLWIVWLLLAVAAQLLFQPWWVLLPLWFVAGLSLNKDW
jgi:hypothetical protein